MTDRIAPIPEWAIGPATDCMQVGAALPTRDGRQAGNATVIWVSSEPLVFLGRNYGNVALVRTDAGNDMRLCRSEIEELFWPPVWLKRIEFFPKAAAS